MICTPEEAEKKDCCGKNSKHFCSTFSCMAWVEQVALEGTPARMTKTGKGYCGLVYRGTT
jgi:hypothetical protein